MSKEKSNALHRDINGQIELCTKLAHVREMLLVWGRVCEFRSAYSSVATCDMRNSSAIKMFTGTGYRGEWNSRDMSTVNTCKT